MSEQERDKIIEKALGFIGELEFSCDGLEKVKSSTVNVYCSLLRKQIGKLKSDDE